MKLLFEQDDDNYKPITVSNFWNNNFIKYESNGERDINLLVKEYINKSKPNLKYIITDLQKSGTWKIWLTIAINFNFSKDTDEEQVMHSKTDNIEIMIYDNLNEVIKDIFMSFLSRY